MEVDIGGGVAVPSFRVRSDRKSDLNSDKDTTSERVVDVDVLVHVLIQHILILYTCLLISLLLWVHMYRRTCGSLTLQ